MAEMDELFTAMLFGGMFGFPVRARLGALGEPPHVVMERQHAAKR